jgi:hypothetical protein
MEDPRSYVYDLMIAGAYTPTDIAIMCLKYMSEADVLDMIEANELMEEV